MMYSHVADSGMGGRSGGGYVNNNDHGSGGSSSGTIQHHYHALHEPPPPPHHPHHNAASAGPSSPSHHYAASAAAPTATDDASTGDSSTQLWDQLNDEEARQVQQHQSRFHVPPHTSRTHSWNIVWSMAVGTLQSIQDYLATSARCYQRAREREERMMMMMGGGGGGGINRRRIRRRPGPGQHPPAAAFDFDLQFGFHDLRENGGGGTIPEGEDEDDDEDDNVGQYDDVETPNNNIIAAGASAAAIREDESKPLRGYPFVVLKDREVPNRQAISNERDAWGMVANLDVFLQQLYQYYYHRGLVPMTCKFFVELFSLLFTLWLSRILLARVDWRKLATCKDETTCQTHWSDYYYYHPTGHTSHVVFLIVQGYTFLILAYAVFSTYVFWQNLQHAIQCRTILHDKLGLSQRKLQGGALAWDTVIRALVDHQQAGLYRTALASTSLDPLSIAQRILRKENFLMAFWNQGLLDGCKIGNRYYWSTTIEWCVYNCVLNFMFNHKYEIRPAFCLDAASLQRRLQVCGVVHLLLLPFLTLFVTLHFFLRNVYDFKTSKQYMGHSQWSTVALWQFREFNELPHSLEQRLEPSYEAASQYVSLFGTSEWMAALGKLLVFVGGAVGGVLLVLGILNDAILLHVQLWGRNLLWYAGISGIIYAVGKALLPSKEATPSVTRNLFEDMDTSLKKVSVYTHYYPENWKGRGWDANVYKSFKTLFDTKVKLFVWELAALVMAPYILFFQLSQAAPAICEFCLVSKARVPAVGDICGFSTFDFDAFKDEAWEGRTLGQTVGAMNGNGNTSASGHHGETLEESIMKTGNLEDATRLHPKPHGREGKMEKSFFTFQAAHPDWKCSPSGQALMDQVDDYRVAEMTRERNLHIEAATRQLETLARLEQQASSRPNWNHFEATHLKNAHYMPVGGVPPADAGAGSQSSPRPITLAPHFPHLTSVSSSKGSSSQAYRPDDSPSPIATPLPLASSITSATWKPPSFPSPSANSHSPTNGPIIHQTSRHSLSPTLQPSLGNSNDFPTRMTSSRRPSLREDMHQSVLQTANLLAASTADVVALPERNTERQYYWLERFHQHIEQQQGLDQQFRPLQQPVQHHDAPTMTVSGRRFGASLPPLLPEPSQDQPAVARSMPGRLNATISTFSLAPGESIQAQDLTQRENYTDTSSA